MNYSMELGGEGMCVRKVVSSRNRAISAWRDQDRPFGCQIECRKKVNALKEELQQKPQAALGVLSLLQELWVMARVWG